MRDIQKDSVNQSVVLRIVDSTTFLPEEGVAFDTSGLALWYRREGGLKVAITPVELTALTDAHDDGGILHISDGYYRVDLPDAAVATGADGVQVGGSVPNMMIFGEYAPLADFVDTAKAVWDRILNGATHNIAGSAGRRLRALQDAGSYEGGQVWVDTILGTPGTVDYENGTVFLPSSNLADSLIILGSLNLSALHIAQGSSIQLVSAHTNRVFSGLDYILDFNGKQVSDCTVRGAVLLGEAVGNGGSLLVENSKFGPVTVPDDTAIISSAMAVSLTLSEAGFYFLDHCSSAISGDDAPALIFGHSGVQRVNCRHWSGGWEIFDMADGDTLSLEGEGQIIIDASCTGGQISARGHFTRSGDETAIAAIDWDDDARWDLAQAIIAVDGADVAAEVTLALKLLQNRKEFDLTNSKMYIWNDGGTAREYETDLTDDAGAAVAATTQGPINTGRWEAI